MCIKSRDRFRIMNKRVKIVVIEVTRRREKSDSIYIISRGNSFKTISKFIGQYIISLMSYKRRKTRISEIWKE